MTEHDPLRDLELMIRSHYGGLLLDTAEEDRAEALAQFAAAKMQLLLFVWRRATGLRRLGLRDGIMGTEDLRVALGHVINSQTPCLYVFHGIGPYLEEPQAVDLIREAAQRLAGSSGAIILTGDDVVLPGSLCQVVGLLHLPAPKREDYAKVLERVIWSLSARIKLDVSLTAAERERLLVSLQGLTLAEAERVLTKAIMEDDRLDADDIDRISKEKRDLVQRGGLLEYCAVDQSMADVAGLENLKHWLEKRRTLMRDPGRARLFGLGFPRGVLLVGVPGCGKSLCAKVVASLWGLPLVRLDPGALYSKYMGETEANLRKALGAVDRFAPLVLWVDEIEKGFASGSGELDGGTSRRVLGTFLSWLQERRGDVFIVATANDVQSIPTELLRKGRFDEIFFVDLPEEPARKGILDIQLRKHNQDPAGFDLAFLAGVSGGYSGADLEQVVVSAMYTALSANASLTTALLLEELKKTPPISSTARERIESVRAWAQGRAVPAG